MVGRKQRLKKKLEEVKKLREKYGHEITHHFASFNKEECGIYLQYKKQSSKDPGMPKELSERQARCLEWMKRPSPPSSPHASDDEGGIPQAEDNAAVVAGLLGLASNTLANQDMEEDDDAFYGQTL